MKIERLLEIGRIGKRESKYLDFKSEFDPSSAADWPDIIKDIIAMANSGGGVVLFGVKNDGSYSGFDKKIVFDIDPAVLADKIKTYTGENFSEFEILEIRRRNKVLAAFLISEAPIPIAFTRNGGDVIVEKKQKPAFIKGSVYFRHGAKSEPGDTNDIRRAIDRVVDQVRKNWFKGVRQISQLGAHEEVSVNIRKSFSGGVSTIGLLKLSEQGKPVKLTNTQIQELKNKYPLSYDKVTRLCKKKRSVKQRELQKYIEHCKKDQSLSINWKSVSKSLDIPTTVPDRYTYSKKVVSNF